MSKPGKIILYSLACILALLVLVAVALRYFVDANVYKPRLQAAASEALGMGVSIGGRLRISVFPRMLLTMDDVHIRNQGEELVGANEVRLGFELMPLLWDEFRVTNVALIHPRITIEAGADGKYNFENPQATGARLPTMNLAVIAFSGATLVYSNKQTGEGVEASDCNLKLGHLLLADDGSDMMKHVSFNAELSCGKIQAKNYALSDLRLSAKAKNGAVDFKPVTLGIFGGQGSGSLSADHSGADPLYHIRFSLRQFHIEELLKAQSPEAIVTGAMDFSTDLTLRGKTAQEIKQSATGEAVLQGENLTLNGHDLDLEFSRFESSQNFNLVDAGAYFFAGPAGLAVTKGYDFASVLKGAGGVSHIPTFVSRWKVENGVMQAQDVAMATDKHRMALMGGVDMANARFVDVTLALLDHKGCAEVEQKISGPFVKPVVEEPNILTSLAGPAIKLLNKGRKLLPGGGECTVIYTGTVAAPQ